MGVLGQGIINFDVAIFGTGYVGVVTGACLANKGHRVTLIDITPARVKAVLAGHAPMSEAGLDALVAETRKLSLLNASTDYTAAQNATVLMIAVGTPSDDQGQADLSALEVVCQQIAEILKNRTDYPVVVVKSTVPPGTTVGLVRQILETSGKRAGVDFGLAMNPEFLSQGNAVFDAANPDRIVLGCIDSRTASILEQLYSPFGAPMIRLSLTEAECVKYAANMVQACLISASNQLAALSEKTPDVDHFKVMQAVHMDRIWEGPEHTRAGATKFLMGGIGFGGSCFPKDVLALTAYAQERNIAAPMLTGITAINEARPAQILEILAAPLQGLKGRRIAVLGLAFKPGTDDLRHSPGLKLVSALKAMGADVIAHDILASVRQAAKPHVNMADDLPQALKQADGAIIATAWPEYAKADWAELLVLMNHPIILDGRLILNRAALPAWAQLYRVGSSGAVPLKASL